MAIKRGSIWLYVSIAFFIGIVAVFFVDGYMGVYDTILINTPGNEYEIAPDFWQESRTANDRYYVGGIKQTDLLKFGLQIENRRFSDYQSNVKVSLWEGGREIKELFEQSDNIEVFQPSPLYEWELDTTDLEVADTLNGTIYVIKIDRNGVERKITLRLDALQESSRGSPEIAPPTR